MEDTVTLTEAGAFAPRTDIKKNAHVWGICRRAAERVAKVDPATKDEFILWLALVATIAFTIYGFLMGWF